MRKPLTIGSSGGVERIQKKVSWHPKKLSSSRYFVQQSIRRARNHVAHACQNRTRAGGLSKASSHEISHHLAIGNDAMLILLDKPTRHKYGPTFRGRRRVNPRRRDSQPVFCKSSVPPPRQRQQSLRTGFPAICLRKQNRPYTKLTRHEAARQRFT